jgi:hypothetical protein
MESQEKSWRIWSLKIQFTQFQKRLEEIKQNLVGVEISPAVIKEIKESREKLDQFFSQARYLKLCFDCPEKCHCCMSDWGLLSRYDLFYFATIDYDLPEPDWKFLEKEDFFGRPWCLFYSKNGCLLKENRRVCCFRYCCQSLYRELNRAGQYSQFLDLSYQPEMATKRVV